MYEKALNSVERACTTNNRKKYLKLLIEKRKNNIESYPNTINMVCELLSSGYIDSVKFNLAVRMIKSIPKDNTRNKFGVKVIFQNVNLRVLCLEFERKLEVLRDYLHKRYSWCGEYFERMKEYKANNRYVQSLIDDIVMNLEVLFESKS